MKTKERKIIHFVGIGGIGISGLAQYYLREKWKISGSDLALSDITDFLQKMGIKIISQYKKSNIKYKNYISKIKKIIADANLVIYSSAIPNNHVELLLAKKLRKKNLTYAEALGELTRKYKTICVSGAHGKSTTTAMLALIMIEAGLDPTVIVGTKLREFDNSNFRGGKSEWLLVEADEWKASFLNYSPWMIVLTNIDREHLDYYKNLNHILKTYKKYIAKLPPGGILAANADDKNIKSRIIF